MHVHIYEKPPGQLFEMSYINKFKSFLVRVNDLTVIFSQVSDLKENYKQKTEYKYVVTIAAAVFKKFTEETNSEELRKFIENYLSKFTLVGVFQRDVFSGVEIQDEFHFLALVPHQTDDYHYKFQDIESLKNDENMLQWIVSSLPEKQH